MDNKEFLKTVDIFKNFSETSMQKIMSAAELGNYPAGKIIFFEGDPSSHLYIIVTGQVEITKKISTESEKILAVLGIRSIFGEMSLFSNEPRTAGARTKTFMNYYKIHRDVLLGIFATDHKGASETFRLLLLTTLQRLEETDRELATVYEINQLMVKGLTLKEFCRAVIKLLNYSVPKVDSGLIYVFDEGVQGYNLLGNVGIDNAPLILPAISPIVRSVGNKIIGGRIESTIIDDPGVIYQMMKNISPAETLMVLPLAKKNNLIGFVLLLNKKERISHSESTVDLINSIAVQLSSAIERQ